MGLFARRTLSTEEGAFEMGGGNQFLQVCKRRRPYWWRILHKQRDRLGTLRSRGQFGAAGAMGIWTSL